jgi:starch-binding outer membrane protein, SusD/RagB family
MKKMKTNKIIRLLILSSSLFSISSCDDFLEPSKPNDMILSKDAYTSDNTALSAVSGIYTNMSYYNDPNTFLGGLTAITGLCSDELNDFSMIFMDYQTNEIVYGSYGVDYEIWRELYEYIYSVNGAIEGLTASKSLSDGTKTQLLGEVYFLRAFYYFYLTNLYGKVPLVTTTDYKINKSLSRSPIEDVYALIVSDLKKAETILIADYPSSDKVRPNLYTAKALLARVYLYRKEWALAESTATEVVESTLYSTEPTLSNLFIYNSSLETIWQIMPVYRDYNACDAYLFIPIDAPKFYISDTLINSFESGDNRLDNWVSSFNYGGTDYYYPAKYKIINSNPLQEYKVVFRLSEMYLIRAEARAELNDLENAANDVDEIRNRAGLLDLSASVRADQTELLDAIMHERQIEFFSEWGHRWFDLNRTGRADALLGGLKPTWKSTAKLWPIPQFEINANPNLGPNNDGY